MATNTGEITCTCRTCAGVYSENIPLISIFKNSINTLVNCKFLVAHELRLLDIKVEENDGLPQQICDDCVQKLSDIHAFRELCNKSQIALKQYFGKNKEKSKTEVEDYSEIHKKEDPVSEENVINIETSHDLQENNIVESFLESPEKVDGYHTDDDEDCISLSEIKRNSQKASVTLKSNCIYKKLQTVTINPLEINFKSENDGENFNVDNANDDDNKDNDDEMNENKLVVRKISGSVRKCNKCNKYYFGSRIKTDTRYCENSSVAITEFCCFYCDSKFETEEIVKKHVSQQHPEDQPFPCKKCNEHFKNRRTLNTHIRVHCGIGAFQSTPVKVKCNSKEKLEKTNFTNVNKSIQHEPIRRCRKCNKFYYLSRIKVDTQFCDRRGDKSIADVSEFCCYYCNDNFESEECVRTHILNMHPKQNPFTCTLCKEQFTTMKKRNQHLQHHKLNPFSCETCNKVFFNNSSLKCHIREIHTIDEYECEICLKQFNTLKKYNYHRQSHEPEKPFKCDKCDKSFLQAQHLTDHESVHTTEKPFQCKICNKNFKRYFYYKTHMKGHNENTSHACDICGKTFAVSTQLRHHIETHSEVFKYQCEYCGKQFRQSSTLNSHIGLHIHQEQIINNSTSQNNGGNTVPNEFYRYSCPKCPQKFRLLSAIEKHVRVHDEGRQYPCSQCDHAYTRVEHLRRHIEKAHLKNRKYTCEHCNLRFLDAYTRNCHVKRRHEQQFFKCSYCDKTFSTRRYVKIHERSHTGEKPCICLVCNEAFSNSTQLGRHSASKHTVAENDAMKEKVLAAAINSDYVIAS